AIDDCSKRAAKVTHMISSVTLLDYEVVARHPERCGVIEFEVCLQGRLPFSRKRHPANDKRQIPEFEWSVQLTLHPWVLGGEIGVIGKQLNRSAVRLCLLFIHSAFSPFIVDDAIVGLAQPLTEAPNQLASGWR
ncbi:MAG: hypothetical protein WCA23_32425, partial [Stellaceae bacterium]